MSPKLSAYLLGFAYGPDGYVRMLDHAREAERVGFDVIQTSSHIVMAPDDGSSGSYTSFAQLRRRTVEEGVSSVPRNAPWLEVTSVLSAMAAVTTRVEVLSSVAIASLYPAPLLAKTAVTIDRLSQGRLRLGVTPSYVEGEYRALGVDFGARGAILDETIAACQALWTPDDPAAPVSFHSPHVRFDDVIFEPKAISRDSIPVYFGGPITPRTIRRIVTMGHGWLPWHEPVDRLPTSIERIKAAMADYGRDPETLVVKYDIPMTHSDGSPARLWEKADLERSFAAVPAVLAAGANLITLPVHLYCDRIDQAPEVMARAVQLWREVLG